MEILLYNPEIPPNTGNIARLCAATETTLHLIKPLGFSLEDRYLKRAGLDYWVHVKLKVWKNFQEYLEQDYHRNDGNAGKNKRFVMTSARRGKSLHLFDFTENDVLVFGAETTGLPPEIMDLSEFHLRIPTKNTVRSLNLATSAGIVLYHALAHTGQLDNWVE